MKIPSKIHEFSIVDKYQLGYRNREDVTNLPPGVLIVGSQNVLTNVSERIQIRQGYALDGQVDNEVELGYLLLQDDSFLLLEDGGKIIL